jgi:hypothetical protein
MKKLLFIFIFLLSTNALAQSTLTFGFAQNSLTANSGAAGTIGTAYTLPGNPASVVTWQSSYSSTPTAITLLLQGSLDNTNWFTLDTTTNTAGEIRTIVTSVKFVRTNISVKTGSFNTTVILVTKAQPTSNASIFSGGSIFGNTSVAGNSNLTSDDGTGFAVIDDENFGVAGLIYPGKLGAVATITSLIDPPGSVATANTVFQSIFSPPTTRTDRSFGLSNFTKLSSGNFGAGINGLYNYTAFTTTGTSTSIRGIQNPVVVDAASGTQPFVASLDTNVSLVGGANITEARGTMSEVQMFGTGTLTTARAYTGTIGNYSTGTLANTYVYYAFAGPSTTASRWSYYAEASSGKAEILDGIKVPLVSGNASSILTITTNTIAPTNQIHHLGAGLVKTITVPVTCYTTCSIMIIPDAAFTTDTTDNISLASTAVINKTLIFVWDGTKWSPSY